ncbi:ribonuclease H-like domain-containing protein [Tanacetum coccineum]
MDLKWQVAMISMRMKKFYKKTGRKLQFDAKEPVGFDKTKVECYNCHKTGHFARECRIKGNQDNRRRDAWNSGNKDGSRTGKKEDSKALVTIDGEGVDWTNHSEEDEDYALMACNSSESDTEVTSCSNKCKESYANLKKLYDAQREQLSDASIEIKAYYQDLDDKTDVLTYHKKLLAEAQKEKEDLKAKVEKWHNSSKNLSKLLNTQMSANDKFGLGYGDHRYDGILSYENEVLQSVFMNKESELEKQPLYDRFVTAGGMNAVPPPMTGNYMPFGPDIEVDYSQFTYGPTQTQLSESESQTSEFDTCESNISTEPSEFVSEPVVNESNVECQPKVWSDAPIIEEYESDSEDEYVSIPTKEQATPSFANQQVKTPRETVKNQFTHSQKPKVDKKELGHSELTMVVTESLDKWEISQTWNNVAKSNKQEPIVPASSTDRTGKKYQFNTARAMTALTKSSTARQRNIIEVRKDANKAVEALRKEFAQETENLVIQAGAPKASSTNLFSTVSTPAKASSTNPVNTVSTPVSTASPHDGLSLSDLINPEQDDSEIPPLEDIYQNSIDGRYQKRDDVILEIKGSRTGKKEDLKHDQTHPAVLSCSNECKESYANLKRLYDAQREKLSDASVEIKAYTQDLDDKTDVLTYHKKLLAKAQKEKDDLEVIVDKWNHSSKNLGKIVNHHMSARDKFGLGYGDYRYSGILSYENEVLQSVFKSNKGDFENPPLHKRIVKTCEMQAVPPPMTGNYLPSGPDIEIDDSQYTYGPEKTQPSESESQTTELDTWILHCDYHVKLAKQVELNKQNMSKGNGTRERKQTWNNVQRVNKQNQFVPLAVQTRTGNIPVNTAKASSTKNFSTARQNVNRQTVLTSTALKVNTVKPIVNGIRPANVFHKTHSPSSRPFKRTTVLRTNFSNQKVYTAKVKEVSTVGEKWDTADNPHRTLKNKGIIDSGCSRHMTGNKAYLADFQDFNGGPVAFGGSKGYITGKGKIKTGKLDFEDVSFVKELQHFNLFSVSQMCDKKNKVLFTDSECLVLSPDFKLPDENQILLKVPRQNNMYSFNLENIVPL